ncbi:F0F1 ATP synthase subunit delta [Roseisalinus antarcticus]|uniref:ATP synthase subunit delta n=1 Tax=Roseisalinus antarcticus TaxID=254357 RepID=A0A1Y5TQY1_9RHOB|nr:F0F1 ATP synthase subunit delta [Roseisalinus antarcticus]SLN69824.1 ATP synthase subunit delta [Roseisalinus antarcticus]
MSEPASISTGIAGRYATAVFDLFKEGDALDQLSSDIEAMEAALAESADLRELIHSPVHSRDEQATAMSAVMDKMDISQDFRNSIALMARKRRLFVVPQTLHALREKLSAERGEILAEVASAKALTKAQSDKLVKSLSERMGADVKLETTVDESLIGGLVIKVGSRMIDSSIRSKLAHLQNTMKEVG